MQYSKETSLGFALTTTLNMIRKKFNKKIKKLSLSSEQYALMKLIEFEKLTPSELANILKRDKATITRIAKSLEEKQYIYKEEINSRSFYIILTDKGKQILKEATEIAQEFHLEMINILGEDELLKTVKNLNKIRDYFEGVK
jgi:DNA-binding MarR family transcriptional regulator